VTGIKNVKKRFLHLCLKVSRKDIDGLTDGICFIDIARAFMSESERVIKRFLSVSLQQTELKAPVVDESILHIVSTAVK